MKIKTEQTIRKGIETNSTFLTNGQMASVFNDDSLPNLKRELFGSPYNSYVPYVTTAQMSQVLRHGYSCTKTGKFLPLIAQKNSSGHWEVHMQSACEIEEQLELVEAAKREVNSLESIVKDRIVIEAHREAAGVREAQRDATYAKEMSKRMNILRQENERASTLQ